MKALFLMASLFPAFLSAQQDTVLLKKYFPGSTAIQKEYYVLKSDTLLAQGPYISYHPNGKLFLKGQYQLGKRIGLWTSYYDNGKVESQTFYCDGRYCGAWSFFTYDGKPASKYNMDAQVDISKQAITSGKKYTVVQVEYPDAARDNGLEGTVNLMVISDSACNVSVQIHKGFDYECDMAALKATRKFLSKMVPPCKNGVTFIPVVFKLN